MAKTSEVARKYDQLRAAVHALLNVTTNPSEVERPIRGLLYGEPLPDVRDSSTGANM